MTTVALNPSFGNADLVRVAGASNLFWVFGGSLVALSLVMPTISVVTVPGPGLAI